MSGRLANTQSRMPMWLKSGSTWTCPSRSAWTGPGPIPTVVWRMKHGAELWLGFAQVLPMQALLGYAHAMLRSESATPRRTRSDPTQACPIGSHVGPTRAEVTASVKLPQQSPISSWLLIMVLNCGPDRALSGHAQAPLRQSHTASYAQYSSGN